MLLKLVVFLTIGMSLVGAGLASAEDQATTRAGAATAAVTKPVADEPAAAPKIVVTIPPATTMPSSPGYHVFRATVDTGQKQLTIPVGIFLPPKYFKSKEPFPILVSLHNQYAKGGDGANFVHEGIARLWVQDGIDSRDATTAPADAIVLRKSAPFIGLAPGCPEDFSFDLPPMPQIVSQLIAQIEKIYRTDDQRIYLTGFSYGGSCTWRIAEQMPWQYAAIVPLSGRKTADPAKTIEALKDMPIYLACGTNEWSLPECRTMHEALESGKHGKFIYHEIKDGTHFCYSFVYTDPKFWQWLLAQKRRPVAEK